MSHPRPAHYNSHAPSWPSVAPSQNTLAPAAAFSTSCGVAKEVLQIAPGQLFPQLFDIHTPYLGSFLIYTANCVLSCCRDLITHSLAYKGAGRGAAVEVFEFRYGSCTGQFGAWLRIAGRDWTDYNDQEWHQNIIWSCPGTAECSPCYNGTWKANFVGTFWIIINTKDRANVVFDSAF